MIEVQNCYQGYDSNWNLVSKTRTAKLSNRCHARLIREARQHFDGFGIDFTQYDEPAVLLMEELVAQIEWTHKESQRQLRLLEVWFDKKTGAILQCGQNYGDIVS
ncbi:hypothetical protein C3Y94_025825 [Rhizobium ruizarguesonis]|uniref:hypothetical protein n=1 Tax=Rhizobium ruizarguesonis TaxID=2081791 RepID=UPI00163AD83B|nr:hypothetical protein [Rhizobium ruizarguesonis]MBC2806573.1 hypothetical protein [Rhizobium ruizarguesonis]